MEKFIDNLKNILQERLLSVFMYGSKVKYSQELVKTDMNVMVIVKNLSGSDIRACSEIVNKWMKAKNPIPVFMDREEWFHSSDVYAMEYADIKAEHRILYGEDLISDLNVDPDNIRFQCEQETKNLLMRFRQFYLENAHSPKRLKNSFVPLAKTCNAIFKAILRVKFTDIPSEKEDIIKKLAEISGLEASTYIKLLGYKRKQCKMNDKETIAFADEIVDALTKLLDYTNNM